MSRSEASVHSVCGESGVDAHVMPYCVLKHLFCCLVLLVNGLATMQV